MSSRNLNELKRMQHNQNISKRSAEETKLIEHSWNEVGNIYNSIANAIVTIGQNVNIAIQSINEASNIDKQEIILTVNGIRRDLEAFTTDLLTIYNAHKDHSGIVNGEDELALCISVFNDYTILSDRLNAVMFPAMLTVTESLAEVAQQAQQVVIPVTIDGEVVIESQHNQD